MPWNVAVQELIVLKADGFDIMGDVELEVVKILLANHVDVSTKDKDGWTALMRASQQGHQKIVKLLKENGAK